MKFEAQAEGYLLKLKANRTNPRSGNNSYDDPSPKFKPNNKQKYEKSSIMDQLEEFDEIVDL